jgi:glycosyltransferase involved in cell wall biosynthesis
MNKVEGVSIIVFQKDVGIDLFNTVEAINIACESSELESIEVIVVDDGSNFPPSEVKLREFSRISDVVYLEKSLGVSGAILSGLSKSKFSHVLPIPGHNMFAPEAIENVIKLSGFGDIVIGCRNNLSRERPPVKRAASRVLRDIYRHLTFYYVGDIHGLILYRDFHLKSFLRIDGGHSNAISVVTPVLANGGRLVQTVAPIQHGHDRRASRNWRHSVPSFKNTLLVIGSLKNARRIYKTLR